MYVLAAAAAAVAVGLPPGDDLHRAPADAEERGAELWCDIAQAVEGQACGCFGFFGQFEGITVAVFRADAEIVLVGVCEAGEVA